ncbi:MAG TPA: bifunctional 2-polyprenyl-6-hydroxyphenol methylase/3-demethylubiquinol 3-O-methyltransferase UbiG [Candidatus Sulfotelmatobacter sp.]|jgi:2-polyprenyl-6-hydroxyphenyl methylase/3-demethylubiquinone-9 3-methyltransferase|nr:bifunctional 2-polyprenyl-6-hydroxyphenol methylase/3-demethylubiquinol 3-O-methyltransferase UbiG [Candidatus Sulfotelmatobacter sp.]
MPQASAASQNGNSTASAEEIARFQAMADTWWDAEGKFKPLHQLNAPRLEFLRDRLAAHFGRDALAERPFEGLTLLDVGCGGGLLCEPLTRLGFKVTGIDAGEKNVSIARLHAEQSGLSIDYRACTPEQLEGQFDVVMCMEVVEHVPDVGVFLKAAAACLRPGGAFFGATMNRTPKAFALAIVGAEYVLRWLPRGTHDWKKFLKPSEFAAALRAAAVETKAFEGMHFSLMRDSWELCRNLDVNYLLYGAKL